jgi:hypothetical protein
MGLPALHVRRLTRLSVLLKAFQINGTVGSLCSPTYLYIGLTQSLSNKRFAFIWLFLCSFAYKSELLTHSHKKSLSTFVERLCASGGNRTRTGVAAHRIFLLLWFSPPYWFVVWTMPSPYLSI